MMKHFLKLGFFLCLLMAKAALPALAQHEGFLYGEVTMVNGEQVKGQILWSAGQRMWVDMMTVEKKDNPVLKYLNSEQLERLSQDERQKEMDWGFMNLWENRYPSRKHTLRCRFGDMAAIRVTGSDEAVITLKNGQKINIYINEDPEYKNQLGKRIAVIPSGKEKKYIEWASIERIIFMPTPSKLPYLKAAPLYGTITTRNGFAYTGQVQWDMDEFLTTNWLNGKSRDGENISIRFQEVASVRPKEEGALVRLHSGKEVYLQDNSNVNRKNQGIVIQHPTWGKVIIRWRNFKEAVFTSYPADASFSYSAFRKPMPLRGTILTDNQTWRGLFIYDLDEKLDVETLDGWDKAGALRQVPFRYIRELSPIDDTHTAVVLKDGQKLLLGDRSDVSEKNWGILVWPQPRKYKYIPWNKVKQIMIN